MLHWCECFEPLWLWFAAVLLACSCPAGSFASASGLHLCQLCPIDTFSDAASSAVCTPCSDIGKNLITISEGGSSASACVCRPGYYSLGPVTRASKEPCVPCDPLTMDCPTELPGTQVTQLVSKQGGGPTVRPSEFV